MPYSIQEIREAVARGWCADANREKEMDSDLAEAISQEILQMLSHAPQQDGPRSLLDLGWN